MADTNRSTIAKRFFEFTNTMRSKRCVIALVLASFLVLVGIRLNKRSVKLPTLTEQSLKSNSPTMTSVKSPTVIEQSLKSNSPTVASLKSPTLTEQSLQSNWPTVTSAKSPTVIEQSLKSPLPSLSEQLVTSASPSSSTAWLNVVQPGSFRELNETFDCITTQLIGLKFPICIYTAVTDKWVSGALVQGGYFEDDVVSPLMRLLQLDHRLQFVDIGANIGLHSLPAARLTQVLAVEPNWRSMARLAKAVVLGAINSNITLVQNAVSKVRTESKMGSDRTNQGHAFLIDGTKCSSTIEGSPDCITLSRTKTVLLNDLLPLMRSKAALLKVDIEGHEINVFTESSAGQFFDQIEVPLVCMEWRFFRTYSPEKVQPLFDFFHRRNYVAFDTGNSRLGERYGNWPDNILFKKLS